jgi:hypothetical protein
VVGKSLVDDGHVGGIEDGAGLAEAVQGTVEHEEELSDGRACEERGEPHMVRPAGAAA